MKLTSREKKFRSLFRKLNSQRKKQARQIDILCRDIISWHRKFVNSLKLISFVSDFYQQLLAANDINSLLSTAEKQILSRVSCENVCFIIKKAGTFELNVFETNHTPALDNPILTDSFNEKLFADIAASNKVCTLDDLLKMGLQLNPAAAKNLKLLSLPLSHTGRTTGFILLESTAGKDFEDNQIKTLTSICVGLSQAVEAHLNRSPSLQN